MIPRRTFIAGLGAAAAWPLGARGQQGVPIIGFLGNQSDIYLKVFTQELERLGWAEGRSVHNF